MEQRLIDLIHDAKRWADDGRDYLPTLGCSKCGKGCMPLCGLGINRKVTPMETKDVMLKTRKSMLETGKPICSTTQIQFVSWTEIVIMCEKAMDCIEEKNIPGKGKKWVFTKPIPTMAGLVCRECKACVLCCGYSDKEVRHRGKRIKICMSCMDGCPSCQQMNVKHHPCCISPGRFLSGQ